MSKVMQSLKWLNKLWPGESPELSKVLKRYETFSGVCTVKNLSADHIYNDEYFNVLPQTGTQTYKQEVQNLPKLVF